MPISKYFHGEGEKVAASMKKTYGDRWKRVFYATENQQEHGGRDYGRGARKPRAARTHKRYGES